MLTWDYWHPSQYNFVENVQDMLANSIIENPIWIFYASAGTMISELRRWLQIATNYIFLHFLWQDNLESFFQISVMIGHNWLIWNIKHKNLVTYFHINYVTYLTWSKRNQKLNDLINMKKNQ